MRFQRFQDEDNGLFVSKLAEGSPAQKAGLKVGDKILRVNNTDVVNVRHQVIFFLPIIIFSFITIGF